MLVSVCDREPMSKGKQFALGQLDKDFVNALLVFLHSFPNQRALEIKPE